MKKTDIALIIIIVAISAGVSYWIANITIGRANEKPIVVRTVEQIKVEEGDTSVDEAVFKKDGINPTVEATISGQDLTSFADETLAPDPSAARAADEDTSDESSFVGEE